MTNLLNVLDVFHYKKSYWKAVYINFQLYQNRENYIYLKQQTNPFLYHEHYPSMSWVVYVRKTLLSDGWNILPDVIVSGRPSCWSVKFGGFLFTFHNEKLGCPIKQKDFSCFWSHSYPGRFLSPDSKDINYFIGRQHLLFPLFVWKNAKNTKDFQNL